MFVPVSPSLSQSVCASVGTCAQEEAPAEELDEQAGRHKAAGRHLASIRRWLVAGLDLACTVQQYQPYSSTRRVQDSCFDPCPDPFNPMPNISEFEESRI